MNQPHAEPYRAPAEPVAETPPPGLTDEQMAELEARYENVGRLKGKRTGGWEVVFRPPTRPEFKTFRANCGNGAKKADAQEMLGRTTVVATYFEGVATLEVKEARKVLDRMLEKYPSICDSTAFSEAMERLMSDAVEVDAK